MNRILKSRVSVLAVLAIAALAAAAVACGNSGSDESADSKFMAEQEGGFGAEQGGGAVSSGGDGDFAEDSAAAGYGFSLEPDSTDPASEPRPAPTPAPSTNRYADSGGGSASDSISPSDPQSSNFEPQAQVGSERVIVRNVDMAIEVANPAETVEQISRMASREGGWVVRTQSTEVHRGAVDIRVPAERLDSVLAELRDLAAKVKSEISTSQDFTEEFTDTTARIQTLQDTVDSLRALFNRAEDIEDALRIQKEITRIQSDIESMQARVNFLSQSAAFSLVRVAVLALPQQMSVDAGPDKLAAVGRSVRFRAEFTPPEGIDEFRIEWDFGDGTGTQVVTAVAPVDTDGRLISAPVTHFFRDEIDSPYIVKVTIEGTGESGAAEGEDVIVVSVNRVPPIEVFAGDAMVATEGEKAKFRGSFTRPEGVSSLSYTWDFGDGTAPVTVDADPETTVAEIEHIFANSRPQGYNVTLTVEGETPAGATEGTDSLQVSVEEKESITAGGFSPGDTSRSALRTLSAIGSGIGTAAIWFIVLSPLWLIAGAIVYFAFRKRNLTIKPGGKSNDS